MKHKLSVTIVCKNEENRIKRCLESIRWADEIVVVDAGSTDKTLDIVKNYTNKIIINADWPGFGPQKKLAAENTTYDWILSIDSDEVVTDELRNEIQALLHNIDEKKVYRINRLTNFCDKFIKHSGWHPDRIVRLYNKKYYNYNNALVHETVSCIGAKKIDLKGKLLHYTLESLEVYMDKRNNYAKAWARSQYEKGRRVSSFSILLHMIIAFFRHYIVRLGFLDGYHGFLVSMIQMQYTFNKYNFLKFMNNSKSL